MCDQRYQKLQSFLAHTLASTHFENIGKRYEGKVRDVYDCGDHLYLIATDRQSAFDISWCTIPLKGQVLNQISTWWFQQIADVAPHHVLASPDPNVTVVRALRMFKIEIVVRGYMTGSTGTSVWVNYANGVRNFCGNILPEGMRKNEPFPHAIVTPSTKGDHDESIDPHTLVARGLATAAEWQRMEDYALALFARGQKIALEHGLILADTKYEMGIDETGTLTIGDEVHTPDSSRYWVAATYEQCLREGREPESLDKEFFRLWLQKQGFTYGATRPSITDDVRLMLSSRYIDLYERMTGTSFSFPDATDIVERIRTNILAYSAH